MKWLIEDSSEDKSYYSNLKNSGFYQNLLRKTNKNSELHKGSKEANSERIDSISSFGYRNLETHNTKLYLQNPKFENKFSFYPKISKVYS